MSSFWLSKTPRVKNEMNPQRDGLDAEAGKRERAMPAISETPAMSVEPRAPIPRVSASISGHLTRLLERKLAERRAALWRRQ